MKVVVLYTFETILGSFIGLMTGGPLCGLARQAGNYEIRRGD
jgi:hypothetical protein